MADIEFSRWKEAYYFSTQGCSLVFSLDTGAFEAPFVAAASLRAFMSKKPAMIAVEWGVLERK